jgi:hypothetical protein
LTQFVEQTQLGIVSTTEGLSSGPTLFVRFETITVRFETFSVHRATFTFHRVTFTFHRATITVHRAIFSVRFETICVHSETCTVRFETFMGASTDAATNNASLMSLKINELFSMADKMLL